LTALKALTKVLVTAATMAEEMASKKASKTASHLFSSYQVIDEGSDDGDNDGWRGLRRWLQRWLGTWQRIFGPGGNQNEPPQRPQQNGSHPGHSTNRGRLWEKQVMFWAVEKLFRQQKKF
jgi:hypothetical protein